MFTLSADEIPCIGISDENLAKRTKLVREESCLHPHTVALFVGNGKGGFTCPTLRWCHLEFTFRPSYYRFGGNRVGMTETTDQKTLISDGEWGMDHPDIAFHELFIRPIVSADVSTSDRRAQLDQMAKELSFHLSSSLIAVDVHHQPKDNKQEEPFVRLRNIESEHSIMECQFLPHNNGMVLNRLRRRPLCDKSAETSIQ